MDQQVEKYEVAFVPDDKLPEAQDWALIQEGRTLIFAVKETRVTPEVIAEAWAAFRRDCY